MIPGMISLADPEGVAGVATPPLNFQKKRGVTSVLAVVISTVSTVSEQERNGQGRRDVGKSVHVQSGHYAARRLSRALADPEGGGLRGLQPPLNFRKKKEGSPAYWPL